MRADCPAIQVLPTVHVSPGIEEIVSRPVHQSVVDRFIARHEVVIRKAVPVLMLPFNSVPKASSQAVVSHSGVRESIAIDFTGALAAPRKSVCSRKCLLGFHSVEMCGVQIAACHSPFDEVQ